MDQKLIFELLTTFTFSLNVKWNENTYIKVFEIFKEKYLIIIVQLLSIFRKCNT